MRGYQYKSEGGSEPKKNPSAYRMLDDGKEKIADAPTMPGPEVDGEHLEEKGFAEPLVKSP